LKTQRNYETDVSLHYHIQKLVFDLAGFYNVVDNYIYLKDVSKEVNTGCSSFAHNHEKFHFLLLGCILFITYTISSKYFSITFDVWLHTGAFCFWFHTLLQN